MALQAEADPHAGQAGCSQRDLKRDGEGARARLAQRAHAEEAFLEAARAVVRGWALRFVWNSSTIASPS